MSRRQATSPSGKLTKKPAGRDFALARHVPKLKTNEDREQQQELARMSRADSFAAAMIVGGAKNAGPDLPDKLEHLMNATVPRLAILIRWSEAETVAKRGHSPALERMAWRGVDEVCRDILHDVEEVLCAAGVQRDGFVTLADGEGGTR